MAAGAGDVFVGRTYELEALGRALDAARSGRGTTVLVEGEAGIGKSRIAAEISRRARDGGFDVLRGRSIDLVGGALPYQPFVEALHPFGDVWRADGQPVGSQRHLFEHALAVVTGRAAAAPVLLVLEDLHWADVSTLDLVVFLAHHLDDVPLVLLVTLRPDEPASASRMRRFVEGVRHADAVLVLEIGALDREELSRLLAARNRAALPAALVDAIALRSEGNPFFAEELLAARSRAGQVPPRLHDLLLQRVAGLDEGTRALLRLTAAAGREVDYPLLRALAAQPDDELRASLRAAVDRGVLTADQTAGTFRFRHALLREAAYATILPGEREELHGRLARELTRRGATGAAELAPHWAAAGRAPEALLTSVAAAREAEAVLGMAEARVHVERALAFWGDARDARERTGLDLAALCSWGADLADATGAADRGLELARRAIDLVGDGEPRRAALLHVRLGECLYDTGRNGEALAALARAVELLPPPMASPERAYALGSLAGGLMMAWRHDESQAIAEQALELARDLGAGEAEVRALTVLGFDRAYLGHRQEGLDLFHQALSLAERIGDRVGLERVYVNLTDVLTMVGRPVESARVAQQGLTVVHRYGMDSTILEANLVEAWIATGQWDEAEAASSAALRGVSGTLPAVWLALRADLEMARGDLDEARAHLGAALATLPEDRERGIYDASLAELALWEHRWIDADHAVRDALAAAASPSAAQLHVRFSAKGLRAQAELAALARARRDPGAAGAWLARADTLLATARHAAARALPVTDTAHGWLLLAEAEHERCRGVASPQSWAEAADAWDALQQPPQAAYCRWRQAEALVAVGASRVESAVPLRESHAVAQRLGARPLLREVEMLAARARLDLTAPSAAVPGDPRHQDELGLTTRELQVLELLARGYTNREVAAALVISVKTAGVHVTHILAKLGAANRREAAAIAGRLRLPHA